MFIPKFFGSIKTLAISTRAIYDYTGRMLMYVFTTMARGDQSTVQEDSSEGFSKALRRSPRVHLHLPMQAQKQIHLSVQSQMQIHLSVQAPNRMQLNGYVDAF
ncbi:hypothetical protein MKW98_002889, partial [Papaver atlanticum]